MNSNAPPYTTPFAIASHYNMHAQAHFKTAGCTKATLLKGPEANRSLGACLQVKKFALAPHTKKDKTALCAMPKGIRSKLALGGSKQSPLKANSRGHGLPPPDMFLEHYAAMPFFEVVAESFENPIFVVSAFGEMPTVQPSTKLVNKFQLPAQPPSEGWTILLQPLPTSPPTVL